MKIVDKFGVKVNPENHSVGDILGMQKASRCEKPCNSAGRQNYCTMILDRTSLKLKRICELSIIEN